MNRLEEIKNKASYSTGEYWGDTPYDVIEDIAWLIVNFEYQRRRRKWALHEVYLNRRLFRSCCAACGKYKEEAEKAGADNRRLQERVRGLEEKVAISYPMKREQIPQHKEE